MENRLLSKLAVHTLILFSLTISIYANENQTESEITEIENTATVKGYFFITPLAEAVYYGRHSPSIGGGLSLSYGDRSVIGISGMFAQSFLDDKKINFLEVLLTLRFFVYKGLFIQLNTGLVVLYAANNSFYFPADAGNFSIGLSAGWRFMLTEKFYIEPYLRGGYPYYGGLGLALGVRF